jgi:hypothetical protein
MTTVLILERGVHAASISVQQAGWKYSQAFGTAVVESGLKARAPSRNESCRPE